MLPIVLWAALPAAVARAQADAKDWPMYNRDVIGTRYNPGESAIGRDNAGRLEEKWRFPAKGSDLQIGVIHATPSVVDGYVYFGTATDPTFYKLTPEGRICWSYRNPARAKGTNRLKAAGPSGPSHDFRFQTTAEGMLNSALVTEDSVYFGDVGGWFYALDRATGAERWKLNGRGKDFPGSHPINVFIASPILADGKVIVGGGAGAAPGRRPLLSRLERPGVHPRPGAQDRQNRVEVRPRAQARALEPPALHRGSLGQPHILLRAGDELDLEHTLLRRGIGHDLLRHRREHRAPAADR